MTNEYATSRDIHEMNVARIINSRVRCVKFYHLNSILSHCCFIQHHELLENQFEILGNQNIYM